MSKLLGEIAAYMPCSDQELALSTIMDSLHHLAIRDHANSKTCARCGVAQMLVEYWKKRQGRVA